MSGDKSAHLNCGLWYEMMPVAPQICETDQVKIVFQFHLPWEMWCSGENTHRAASSQWNYTNFKGETTFYCPVTDWCHYMQ